MIAKKIKISPLKHIPIRPSTIARARPKYILRLSEVMDIIIFRGNNVFWGYQSNSFPAQTYIALTNNRDKRLQEKM